MDVMAKKTNERTCINNKEAFPPLTCSLYFPIPLKSCILNFEK